MATILLSDMRRPTKLSRSAQVDLVQVNSGETKDKSTIIIWFKVITQDLQWDNFFYWKPVFLASSYITDYHNWDRQSLIDMKSARITRHCSGYFKCDTYFVYYLIHWITKKKTCKIHKCIWFYWKTSLFNEL